ncbi:MAG: S8 family serine peptidase [Candidatus Syntrophosphaera sp.]|nr:S8 family serine peptidase [Candidatus Syntrophosphaera sp.]
MRKSLTLTALLLLGLIICLPARNITPGQLIFKSSQPLDPKSDRTGLTAFDSYLNQLGAFNLRPIRGMHTPQYFLVDLAQEPDWAAVKSGSISFPGIEYVQPNGLSSLHLEPNDPLYHLQFHDVTSNPQAWNYTTGSSTVIVGVIDSGALIHHPDLWPNIYINPGEIPDNGIDDDGNGYIDDWCGWDFADAPELSDTAVGDYLEQDNDVEDENFHGTHVAGIVGAVGNNGIGVTGVAWNVKIMPIRAGFRTTTGAGYLQDDDAAAAIIYAADNGCHIINMSWGDPEYSPIIGDACQYAYDKGVTLVASAGNDPGPYLSYPAKLSTVISVGAINRTRTIAGFSSYGMDMDLVAPGEMVLSTYKLEAGEQYFEQSGTSMSAPYVCGAAALLLSLHPGLSPAEVRARLCSSTDDLGVPGFDQFYGHGLLNTKKLLENTTPPLVYIDTPLEQSGITDSVDITGTVKGDHFFRYSVMYTDVAVPTILDWFDVQSHQNYPTFHTQQVENGVLARFHIPDWFPEGVYTIRVQFENSSGSKYNYYRAVEYDRSPPALIPESLQGFRRYDGQNLRFYISAVFTEPVRAELIITDSSFNVHNCYGTQLDSLHVWPVPQHLPEGRISFQLAATNISGLSYTSGQFVNFMDIGYEVISSYGYAWEHLGMARVPLNYTYDYNGDGYPEYIAMDLPTSGYGNVFVYQPGAAGHQVMHSFNDNFWILGAGNTNEFGMEILQLKADTAILLESQLSSTYPNLPIWEATAITGGVIADYTGDGIDDILLVKNLPAERIIQAYRRSGNTFLAKNVLHNTSETNVRNTFVPTIIVKNFDNDNYLDILTADTDGDLMIYEIRNDNLSELVWSYRMPIGNTYSLTSGDFDGNGSQDFFVGGYYRDILDQNQNFWYFEGFRNVANNSYASMGSIMFNEVISQNAIQAADLDNDGKDEIILAIAPNLYVLKYEGGRFVPKFCGESFRTYSILTYKDANNRPYFLTNYKAENDSVFAVEWTSDDPFTGPPTPANFLVRPLDEQSVDLSWIDSGAQHYRIYRRDESGDTTLIDNLQGTSYLDTGLTEGQTYQYAITAWHSNFSPAESVPTIWQNAVPFHVPIITSIEMVGRNQLRIMFDQQMGTSIINPTLYYVSHGIGHPSSANHIATQHGVHLQFSTMFPAIGSNFILNLSEIVSANGILMQDLEYEFAYQEDTVPPRVEGATVMEDKRSVQIVFSEPIAPLNPSPELLLNYTLHCHSNDPDNFISSVVHLDDRIQVNLANPLKFGSSAYQIRVDNLRDLAGNTISPQQNIARFALVNTRDLKDLIVYPNPVRQGNQLCRFLNFPSNKKGNIRIYDSSGHLVMSASIPPFDPNIDPIHKWDWDLKNNNGSKVSSGVYFYVIEMGGEIGRGKIAIIN